MIEEVGSSKPVQNNESSSTRKRSKIGNRTLNIAITGMLAGVYASFTLALGNLSFGFVNLRLSNVLIGVVPLLGWPSVYGIALGVFLGNVLGSNLGPLDYLISPIFSLIGLIFIHLLRNKSVLVGLATYSMVLSLWVSFELSFITGVPYFPLFYFVSFGITFVVLVLGYVTYRALNLSGLKRRIVSVVQD